MYACDICLSIYAIYDFVYMSHKYTYTYVRYLHKHIWHTPNNICYLYVYTYKLRNPASFPDRRWSGKETGFLSLVYMYMYSIYTNTKVTYVHIRNLMSLSSYFIYVHAYMLPTYTYICHLHKYPYVKDAHMHAYVIHMWYVYMYYCTWHMHMYICTHVTYMHIYMCYLHTHYICYLHTYPTYIHTYIHTCVGHMHIGIWHIDMWCICMYRDMTYIHYVYMSHMYVNMYIWHLRAYIHMLPMYICICDIDTYVTCVQMSIHT